MRALKHVNQLYQGNNRPLYWVFFDWTLRGVAHTCIIIKYSNIHVQGTCIYNIQNQWFIKKNTWWEYYYRFIFHKKETAFSIEKVESKSNFLNFNLICKSFSGVFCEHW